MNAWLLRAPWWKTALLLGCVIAPLLVLLIRVINDRSWVESAIIGLLATLLAAPALGFITARQVRSALSPDGSPLNEASIDVERASRRGPVPEDPALREAALRVVEGRLLSLHQTRTRARVTASTLVLVSTYLAVSLTPWWWLAVGASGTLLMLMLVLLAPAAQRRRADLLRK